MKRIDIIYNELTLKYLNELNDIVVIWVQLVGGEKRPTRSWAHFIALHEKQSPEERLGTALEWLRKGYGLGFLPRNGLWVLDCDSPETTLRADEFLQDGFLTPIRVNTPSGGAHFYFQYPTGFNMDRLKNHVCHPKDDDENKIAWDFKLGHRTLLVAPGTQTPKGFYMPSTPWISLPRVDPRALQAEVELYKPNVPFLVNDRDFTSRVRAAQEYIKRHARVSVEHDKGGSALHSVAAHLVAYLQLDPAFAYYMLTKPQKDVPSWNIQA